jgi:hypothetical protein
MSGLGSEAIGWAISNLFHEIAQYYPVNTWHPFDSVFPFTPLPAGGSTGLLYPSVSCIDDQYNGVSANIYIDGSNYGNNPSLTLTPEAHYIRVDYYIPDSGGYGYTFSYMVVDGNNYYDTQNDIELSSNSTIEVHYIYEAEPSNLLDVQAISWGDWGSLQADVSIDNYISDTTEFETLLGPGTHIISIPMLAWDETFGWVCFNGVISTDLDCAIMLSGDPYVIEFTIPNDQNPHTLTFYYFAG